MVFMEIHKKMAAELTRELDGITRGGMGSPSSPAGPSPRNQAYSSYLKGWYFLRQRTKPSMLKAVHEFEAAIQQDGIFAASYGAIALTYDQLAFYGISIQGKRIRRRRAMPKRACCSTTRSVEAFLFLAEKKAKYDHDWDGADAGYRKAIELDPECRLPPVLRTALAESGTLRRSQTRRRESISIWIR